MKKREIFSLLVSCREVTYDDKDNMRRVYIDEEKSVKKLDELKKAINTLPSNVQSEFQEYQIKVMERLDLYKYKYPQLMVKAKEMWVPGDMKKAPEKIVVIGGTKDKEPSEAKEGD